jgi:hypothetical protein
MGERAADKGHILHAGEANIADILPQAPHQALVHFARQPRADALGRFGAVSVGQCETSSIRRCAARGSWLVPAAEIAAIDIAQTLLANAIGAQAELARVSRRRQMKNEPEGRPQFPRVLSL